MTSVTISGRGLHSGRLSAVTLSSGTREVFIHTARGSAPLSDCVVRGLDRGVRIGERTGAFEVESVEHLFAALGAWPVRRGIDISVDGDEIPLADGGAARFADALVELAPPRDATMLSVARPGRVEVGDSTYEFEPGPHRVLDVEIDFAARRIGKERAGWDGSFEAFVAEVAWARTFGFRREAEGLFARERARGADLRAVMVLGDDGGVEPPGLPARPGEFARHKLLDLIGDLYSFGGPPLGVVHAQRPGHHATHHAITLALKEGILASSESAERPGAW
jgi:UDP-3-O-[3-hydroxymyristoyl] N-acetylglucosamine deacetylase